MTRPTSAPGAAAKASPSENSKAGQETVEKASDGGDGPEVPPVTTLLEFVAWVVLTGQALCSKAVGEWSKGRGAYLLDELDQVKEASIRVQVRHPLVQSVDAC